MIPGVYGFFSEYKFLSNFWPAEVVLDDRDYPTTEHAYQAAKTFDLHEREYVRSCCTPGDAKRLGRQVTMRLDWEEVKVDVMRNLLQQKFAPGSELAEKLINTQDLYLEETNTWNDTFWGVCNGKGSNVLGNLLMEIRRDLIIAKENP